MSKHKAIVNEEFQLEGHCMVAYPDGTVVTSNGSYRFPEPGEYRVIYDIDAEDVDTVTVTTPDAPAAAPDAPATGSSDGPGASGGDAKKSPSTGVSDDGASGKKK